MKEYKSFYTKSENDKNTEEILTPIDGYTFNEDVSCLKCKYFKEENVGIDGWGIEEKCKHKENVFYTYDHTGRHGHILWEPKTKNKLLNCELYEEKKNIFQKIKVRLNIN